MSEKLKVAMDICTWSNMAATFKKNFMASFYGWGSTASRPVPLRGGSLLFPLSSQIFLVLILSTPEGWKAECRPWSHQVVLNMGPKDWKSSALPTRPLLHKWPLLIFRSWDTKICFISRINWWTGLIFCMPEVM